MMYRLYTLLRLFGLMVEINEAVLRRTDSATEGLIAAENLTREWGFDADLTDEILEWTPAWVWCGYGTQWRCKEQAAKDPAVQRHVAWLKDLERKQWGQRLREGPTEILDLWKRQYPQSLLEDMVRPNPRTKLLKENKDD